MVLEIGFHPYRLLGEHVGKQFADFQRLGEQQDGGIRMQGTQPDDRLQARCPRSTRWR